LNFFPCYRGEINFSIQFESLRYFYRNIYTCAAYMQSGIILLSQLWFTGLYHLNALHIRLFIRVCICADVENARQTLSGTIGLTEMEEPRLSKQSCKSFSSEAQRLRMSEKSVTFTTVSITPRVMCGANFKRFRSKIMFARIDKLTN